jgi:hypothetical protein
MCEKRDAVRYVREADYLAVERHRDDLLRVIADMKAAYEADIARLRGQQP